MSNVRIALYCPYMMSYKFSNSVWPNSTPLHHIRLQNLSDLDTDVSRSFTVECDGTIELPIYGFLLIFHNSINPNSAPLGDRRLKNQNDLEVDLSTSFKVKCDSGIGLHINGLIVTYNLTLLLSEI